MTGYEAAHDRFKQAVIALTSRYVDALTNPNADPAVRMEAVLRREEYHAARREFRRYLMHKGKSAS